MWRYDPRNWPDARDARAGDGKREFRLVHASLHGSARVVVPKLAIPVSSEESKGVGRKSMNHQCSLVWSASRKVSRLFSCMEGSSLRYAGTDYNVCQCRAHASVSKPTKRSVAHTPPYNTAIRIQTVTSSDDCSMDLDHLHVNTYGSLTSTAKLHPAYARSWQDQTFSCTLQTIFWLRSCTNLPRFSHATARSRVRASPVAAGGFKLARCRRLVSLCMTLDLCCSPARVSHSWSGIWSLRFAEGSDLSA